MATLSRHPYKRRFRVRYKITYPDGRKVERSRLCHTKKEARALLARAEMLEEMTRFANYTPEEVKQWQGAGLLSRPDLQALMSVFDTGLPGYTLKEAVSDYLAESKHLSRGERQARGIRSRNILRILGLSTPLASLKPSDAEILKRVLLEKGYSPNTVNKHLRDLKRIAERAVSLGLLPSNPFSAVKPLKNHKPFQPRVLSPQEVEMVLAEARKSRLLYGWMYLIFLFAFGCGLRRSEILSLQWEWIDWERRLVFVKKTKTGKPRFVGLGERLYRELVRLKEKLLERGEIPKGRILPPIHHDSITSAAARVFRRCGLSGVRFHDARHTYATHLQILAGASPVEAMARTGHSSVDMLLHYSHPANPTIFEDALPYMREGK
ncbi:site-specific integrase [Thermosulfurimonas sp. F29]|uniref:tyrosine-type recombinase/integrase n=1 Tax=Thermosulfurimonas sp. F29 TaxID=2867247 RepID=UPI001C82FA38|nr:site-specific integrase [Thermosulfurimonas sp. F29]MBX6422507.1 tyrosine-type recombinase/integrase [Thermosulfurimonas sp. F29]